MAVGVVSWNTRELLRRCLASLRADADEGLAEVWVVDNASSDGSAAMVLAEFPWVRLLASTENVGFGAAVNMVAARTETQWIAPANADVRLEPRALTTLLEEGERHLRAAALAPRLILPNGATQRSVFPFPTIPFALAYSTGALSLSQRLSSHWNVGRGFDPDRPRDVSWAVGAFVLVRRVAWDAVGGFDEARWMYAEDLDLGWRLARADWRTRYVPKARVFHEEAAATSQAWGADRYARWHASTYSWMAQRRGFAVARLVALVYVVGYLVRAVAIWPAALIGLGQSEQVRQRMLNGARTHMIGLRSRVVLEGAR